MDWLNRYSNALQAIGTLAAAVVAIVALLGIKWQIDATYDSQREQSARDIYREFLSLSVANPDLARPDYCALRGGPRGAAYESYVDYMLYSMQQSLELEPVLGVTYADDLKLHSAYLCQEDQVAAGWPETAAMLEKFRNDNCKEIPKC
jgi:hypothetical protein